MNVNQIGIHLIHKRLWVILKTQLLFYYKCTSQVSNEKITLLIQLDIPPLVSTLKTSIESFVNGNYAGVLEQKILSLQSEVWHFVVHEVKYLNNTLTITRGVSITLIPYSSISPLRKREVVE